MAYWAKNHVVILTRVAHLMAHLMTEIAISAQK